MIQNFVVNNSNFTSNSANRSGGAIHAEVILLHNCTFVHNFASKFGGAIQFFGKGSYELTEKQIFISSSRFEFNEAGEYGGAIDCRRSIKDLLGAINLFNCSTVRNRAAHGGFLHLVNCYVSIGENKDKSSNITSNKAIQGGAIYAEGSDLYIFGYLSNNTAEASGGAIFAVNSRLFLDGATFSHNWVTSTVGKGGAIYIQDSNCESVTSDDEHCMIDGNGPFLFVDNRATYSSVLYGGLLDRCIPVSIDTMLGITYFKHVSSYYEQQTFPVTSGPVKLCFCLSNS